MQAPASYNLTQVLEQIKTQKVDPRPGRITGE